MLKYAFTHLTAAFFMLAMTFNKQHHFIMSSTLLVKGVRLAEKARLQIHGDSRSDSPMDREGGWR
ncbi:MAG: hypothetical protein UY52_C0001G0075 [Parcubacteria group bacterium GW2011_GWC2_49_9]|nr:MAG: hypothetical protein UY34_C0017G0002 [Parcubacteria group bacterium GW2011_GWA2_48_9]KKW16755.1 MAG: hypothetical protein UY52_C0001G0075 [Parcubacteria group bacterium GW2011_GWC2_49_9]